LPGPVVVLDFELVVADVAAWLRLPQLIVGATTFCATS
jgi:hypothetical protein